MPDSGHVDDSLSLEGLGGLFNGEVFVLGSGQSATLGSSTIASFPVTLCRNFRRLEGTVPLASFLERMAPEHVRFLYLGEGRLIVENLASRDVKVGRKDLPERSEVDLAKGRVEIEFAYGERILVSAPCAPEDLQCFAPPPDEAAEIEGVFKALLDPERMADLSLLPDEAASGEAAEAEPPSPETESSEPEAGAQGPAEPEARARSRRGGPLSLLLASPAWVLSILFHAVLLLGLFTYVSATLSARDDSLPAVVVVTPPEARIAEPDPPTPEAPTEPEMENSDLAELSPTIAEAENRGTAEDMVTVPGADSGPGNAGEGPTGVMGIGPGGLGTVPGGPSGGRSGPQGGGASVRDKAVGLGLDWLARHQLPDGSWGGIGSVATCGECTAPGGREYRAALTGLATLAFVGAGSTHRGGRYRNAVKSSARYLVGRQEADGSFHPGGTPRDEREMYGNAMAVFALSELYRRSDSPFLRTPAEKGVRFIERAQAPYGAWRYQPGERGSDTSVTGWQILALTSASRGGIPVNPAAFFGAKCWIESMTEPSTHRVGYNKRGRGSLGMTATGVALRLIMGGRAGDPSVRGGAKLLRGNLPFWIRDAQVTHRDRTDINYWYFGTLAAQRAGGDLLRDWNRALLSAIRPQQIRTGHEKGSWPAPGRWGAIGGRVFTTAVAVILLELHHGYEEVFK